MPDPDSSWTVAPALLCFGALLLTGLRYLDGDLGALQDRLTASREPGAASAGPAFAPAPAAVAEVEAEPDAAPAAASSGGGGSAASADAPGRAPIGALEDVCLEGPVTACKRWALDGYYRSLTASKGGKLGRALRVSWYGDSVIAGDTIPGRMRSRLQRDLGDGGPGFVFVVPPHRFCLHEAVTRTFRDAEWLSYAVSTVAHPDGLYGPGGATAETYGATATLKLVAGTASEVELYYLAQRGGGTIKVSADGAEVIRVDTRAEQKAAERAVATVAGGAARFRLEAAKGRARVFGIALENRTGAVVDNLGIVSANVLNFAQRDTAHFTAALAQRGADLAIIMLGANEARWLSPRDQDTKQYQARFERAIEPLRKARPGASCLVVAPTDQAEVVDGSYRSRPVMPVLVGAQRRAAHAQGCAFFDTYRWMGGKGSAVRWNRGGLLGGDFTHLSIKGAHRLADAVHDALMTGHHRDARP